MMFGLLPTQIFLAASGAFGWILAYIRIPSLVAGAILSVSDNRVVVLILLNVIMLNLGIGLTTPPVGAALFAVCSIGKVNMGKVVKAAMPMYLVMLIVLILVNAFPDIVMFLPELIMG